MIKRSYSTESGDPERYTEVLDIIRDIAALLKAEGLVYEDLEIGGFGSVHLDICEKQ